MADLNNLLEELEADPLDVYEEEEEEDYRKETGRPSVETAATEPLTADDWDSPGTSRRFVAIPAALQDAKRQKGAFVPEETVNWSQGLDDDEVGEVNEWYAKLHQFWHQEKHCPELLEYDTVTVEEIKAQIEERQQWLDQITEEMANPNLDAGDMAVQNLFANLAQVDLDRVKYALASWMAERLAKIEAHPLHMRAKVDHLSDTEFEYLKEYGSLLHEHLQQTVLDHIPQAWQKIDEPNMIDQPDYDGYHFWLVKEMIGVDEVEQEEGSTLVAKYTAMKEYMKDNKVELLL